MHAVNPLHLVLMTGLSGSGKSVALRVLEEAGYLCIDNLPLRFLRDWVLHLVQADRSPVLLTFESFAYKHDVPSDADLVFDVRCLPNPYYEPALRALTGRNAAVAQ